MIYFWCFDLYTNNALFSLLKVNSLWDQTPYRTFFLMLFMGVLFVWFSFEIFLKTCSKFKWNQTVVSLDILQNKVILFSCSTLFCSYFHRLLELRDLKFQMMSNWWALLSSVLIKLFVPPGTVTCLKMWKLKRQKKKNKNKDSLMYFSLSLPTAVKKPLLPKKTVPRHS